MATWLDRLVSRVVGTAEPRARRRRDGDASVSFYDVGTPSASSGDSTEQIADSSDSADSSFDAAFGGGESGGAGASADFGGDSGGGDSGGGDGGGGGD